MEMIKFSEVENKVLSIRNQQVILNSDVAVLYDVETREVNQAIKNNPEKFPPGYIFELTPDEKSEVIKIFDNPDGSYEKKPFVEGLFLS
jgi:hypothetical protein